MNYLDSIVDVGVLLLVVSVLFVVASRFNIFLGVFY